MSKTLISVPSIAEMRSIKKALDSDHQAFPVLNTAGHLIGLLPKVVLNEIMKQKLFYDSRQLSTSFKQKNAALNPDEDQHEQLLDPEAMKKANKQYAADYDEKEGGFPATPLSKQIGWKYILPSLD